MVPRLFEARSLLKQKRQLKLRYKNSGTGTSEKKPHDNAKLSYKGTNSFTI